MAAIAAGFIVAGVVTLLVVIVQTSAGMQLALILPRSIVAGCGAGFFVGIVVSWIWG